MSTQLNPLLCYKYEPKAELRQALAHMLGKYEGFDVRYNMLGPSETRRNPQVAISTRLKILLRVYAGDYHTDSFEVERLSARIREDNEGIWFYGARDQIAHLRALLSRNEELESKELDLGTITAVSAETICGPGHGELCRSGSMASTGYARPAILARALGYLDGHESTVSGSYHTLILTSRNRRSTDIVRGGEAIHRIHTQYVRSRFWGFAPWYVMQGGVLEQLDYRECNRDPEDVLVALRSSPTWWLPGAREAEFVEALCRLNFGLAPAIQTISGGQDVAGGKLSYLPPPTIRSYNYGCVSISEAPDAMPLEMAIDEVSQSGVCCTIVRVRIDNPAEAVTQVRLKEIGFRLNAIVPPKRTTITNGQEQQILNLPAYAFWCRPHPNLSIEPPFYVKASPATSEEETILSYQKDFL